MNKIKNKLNEINARKKIGLMTHIVLGYPNFKESEKIMKLMADKGVDFIEMQIPFSDPMADGPVIEQANVKSLANGANVKQCFEFAKKMSKSLNTPLLFMCYFNTIFNIGIEEFCKKAAKYGVQGIIVPDYNIDQEDYDSLLYFCDQYNISFIPLITPTTTIERMKMINKLTSTFAYCVARLGITGKSTQFDSTLINYMNSVNKYISKPKALGFGIKTREHILELQKFKGKVDIAVVGSAVINKYNEEGIVGVEELISELVN